MILSELPPAYSLLAKKRQDECIAGIKNAKGWDLSPDAMISSMFDWEATPEGGLWWSQVHVAKKPTSLPYFPGDGDPLSYKGTKNTKTKAKEKRGTRINNGERLTVYNTLILAFHATQVENGKTKLPILEWEKEFVKSTLKSIQ